MMHDSPKETREADLKRLKDAANTLSEFFDTVQIFVTRYNPNDKGSTTRMSHGSGNFFARYGQARYYLLMEDEVARAEGRESNDAQENND